VKILNKQMQAADMVWSPNLQDGQDANNSSPKETNMVQNVTQGLGLGQILWNDLGNGIWA